MTVASGSGDEVAEEGRKRPVAVFCLSVKLREVEWRTYCLGLESLNEDSVEEGL
jgi:hypothetical protein